jgi:hypothetical protein
MKKIAIISTIFISAYILLFFIIHNISQPVYCDYSSSIVKNTDKYSRGDETKIVVSKFIGFLYNYQCIYHLGSWVNIVDIIFSPISYITRRTLEYPSQYTYEICLENGKELEPRCSLDVKVYNEIFN